MSNQPISDEQILADLMGGDSDSSDDLGFTLPTFDIAEDEANKKKRKKKKLKKKNKDSPKTSPKPSIGKKTRSKSGSGSVSARFSKFQHRAEPSSLHIKLTGKSSKIFEKIYNKHENGGVTLFSFNSCLKSLNVIDGKNLTLEEVPAYFYEATGNVEVADSFDMFLQALALVALKRYPHGISDDATAALERLRDGIDEDDDGDEIRRKKRAVYEAKKRAAKRAKALRAKGHEADEEALHKEELEGEQQERLSREKIAKQRAYLRVKARLRAQKEKEEAERLDREKEEADAEEKAIVIKELRAQALKRGMQKTKARLAAFRREEEDALEQQSLILLNSLHSEETRLEAVNKAEARVKAAKRKRVEIERIETIQKEAEAIAQEKLNIQKQKMSQESFLRAMMRTKKRLQAKMRAEEEQFMQLKEEAMAKAERESKIVADATARASKRSSVKKIKIDLDDETITDLHKMFDSLAIKKKLHKARWFEFIQKYKLCDGINLRKGELDGIFSKAAKKGTKGLEFKHFCKAVAAVGNKRYPVKKNIDPNDAIDRVLQNTVRKHDKAAVKKRKAELRKAKKAFVKEQRQVDKRDNEAASKKANQEIEDANRRKEGMKKRIEEQLKQLEIDKKERSKKNKKRAAAQERAEMKELERLEKAAQEQMVLMIEKKEQMDTQQKAAQKRTKERLKLHSKKLNEEEEAKKKDKEEREIRSKKVAEAGRIKALERLEEIKKKEVRLGKEDENNLRTLFDHYKSGGFFKRADWLNCTTTLGLHDGVVVKKFDLENFFNAVMNQGASGIDFKQFCIAMGSIAKCTHPGEEGKPSDNLPTKCLERLLFDILGGDGDDDMMEFDPTLDESYLDGFDEETEEEKAERIAEEKEKKKIRRAARKKRNKEAQERADEEERIKNEIAAEKQRKVDEARYAAANRVLKKKKEEFTISQKDADNLEVLYDYFQISRAGMSRADWLNCTSTLGVQDDEMIKKQDCEKVFEEVCETMGKGITVEQFGTGMSLLAMRKYEGNLNQTKSLVKLMSELMEDGE